MNEKSGNLYSVWIRIDKSLPWIELKGEYETKEEAKEAAKTTINDIHMKLVNLSPKRRRVENLITVRTRN
jgi:hypothetical protein